MQMMSSEGSTWLFFDAYSGEIRRTLERHRATVAGCDDFVFEPASEKAAYLAGGRVVVTMRAELLARYSADVRVLRWGWAERMVGAARIDAAYREGERLGLAHLQGANVRGVPRADADRLAYVGMHLSRAVGMHLREEEGRVEYIALFGRDHERPSARPSAVVPRPSAAPGADSAAPEVCLPSPELVGDCARAMLPALHEQFAGYREALLAVRVEPHAGRLRFFVHVTVLDKAGELDVLAPTPELSGAVRDLILAGQPGADGRWRELVLRVAGAAAGGGVRVLRFG